GLHVLWPLRGKRPASLEVPKGPTLNVFDSMDNAAPAAEVNGKATFTVSTSPVYVRGLAGDAKVTLGAPDHSDAKPGPNVVALAELGDGSWKLSADRDREYEDVHIEFMKKFPGKFSLHDAAPNGEPEGISPRRALAVHLEKQEKERRTMPFYTTLVPPKPNVVPGQAS